MNGQRIRVGKGLVHSRVRSKLQGKIKADNLIDLYVNKPREARKKLAEEWLKLARAGVPLGVIAEEYNTSITSVSVATNDPEEWLRRGTSRSAVYNKDARAEAGVKALRTRRRRQK